MKKNSVLLMALMLLSVTSVVIGSCDDDVSNPSESEPVADNFLQCLRDNADEMLSIRPISYPPTACEYGYVEPDPDSTVVYVECPSDYDGGVRNFADVESLSELILLAETAGVVLNTERTAFCTDSVYFSSSEAKEKSEPLVLKSREYLYKKGFTDEDIQQMLDENSVDESVLVPFVLACIEVEMNEVANTASCKPASLNSLFAINAIAAKVNWNLASDCALQALGLNVFWALGQSNLKTWGVAAMKKAFKTVATKVVGPVGALITVGTFAYCYISKC